MSCDEIRIKSMKLYTNIERIHNELAELGKTRSDLLDSTELSAFDQLHYHGTKAIDEAIVAVNLCSKSKVLDIGSGLGGPARHIFRKTSARVTALELQSDQHALAQQLSTRCRLAHSIEHVCGNFLTYPWGDRKFTIIVSWLSLFHISDRHKLLQISAELLEEGGLFYTEDMYCRQAMNPDEAEELKEGMYTGYMPDWATYLQDVRDAGFEIVKCDDMSDDWTAFTSNRLQDYRLAKKRHIRVHGEQTYQALEQFYDLVDRHFRSGKLGGIRLVARKT